MPQVLVMSSWVARGHVGLSAIVPVLQALGCEAVALPTVILSNHPGHAQVAGGAVPVQQLREMSDALDGNGWLGGVDAILTGYFPSADHVALAKMIINRVRDRNPAVHICCDPVLGDDPDGLYVPASVAEAIRDDLIPLSDSVTPNRFELAWLSGLPVDDVASAVNARRALTKGLTLATSIPTADGHIANVVATQDKAWSATSQRLVDVPHGTGDALAAAFLAHRLLDRNEPDALGSATGSLAALVAASRGKDELQLTEAREAWLAPPAAVSVVNAAAY